MVNYCCAFNCTNASDKNPDLIFHSIPNAEKENELRLKWIHAIKRKNWQPGKSSKLCSAHFQPTNYEPAMMSGRLRLKRSAIPSVFDYPDHLQPKQVYERRPLVRITTDVVTFENYEDIISPVIEEPSHKCVAVQTNLTGIELTNTLNNLQRDKKCLQQQLQRRNARVS